MNRYLEKAAATYLAQPLDNNSDNFHSRFDRKGRLHNVPLGTAYSRVSKVGKVSAYGKERISDGLRINTKGKGIVITTSGRTLKDVAGRNAPVSMHVDYHGKWKNSSHFAKHHTEGLKRFSESLPDGNRVSGEELSKVHDELKSFYRKRKIIAQAPKSAAAILVAAAAGISAKKGYDHMTKSKG